MKFEVGETVVYKEYPKMDKDGPNLPIIIRCEVVRAYRECFAGVPTSQYKYDLKILSNDKIVTCIAGGILEPSIQTYMRRKKSGDKDK